MIDQSEIKKIKEITEKFFQTATIPPLSINVDLEEAVVNIKIKLSEPQILIGEKGQTLFEIQKILKIILNKKTGHNFYLNLDINDYKSKKSEYLKNIAKDLADEVSVTKKEKALIPMSPYERRVVHAELSKREDIFTESRGDGYDRHIIIKPK